MKLLNIDAATNADIQSDQVDPILTLTNSSGPGLSTNKLIATSAATIAGLNASSAILGSVSSLDVDGAILAANATVTAIDIRGASVASGANITFSADAAKGLATIDATEGGVAGTYGIRVAVGDGTFGWIPIYPDAAVTGDAL